MRTTNERVRFNEMPCAELVKYLVDVQHPYLLKAFSAFSLCGNTVSDTGERGTKIMASVLQRLHTLIQSHLMHDEHAFFVRLGQLAQDQPVEDLPALLAGIRKEHASITRLFKKLRLLSNDYTPPEQAPATLKLCYAQLFNFEQDMLKHVFLEEDILFPKLLEANRQKVLR